MRPIHAGSPQHQPTAVCGARWRGTGRPWTPSRCSRTTTRPSRRCSSGSRRRVTSAYVEKRSVVDKIIEELSIHAAIEEQLFYPVTRATVPDTEDIALESLEEHHIVKWVLSELDGMDPEDERFDAKVTVLIENVRHHVEGGGRGVLPQGARRAGPQRPERPRRRHGGRQGGGPDPSAPPLARHAAGQPRRRHGRRRGGPRRRHGQRCGPGRCGGALRCHRHGPPPQEAERLASRHLDGSFDRLPRAVQRGRGHRCGHRGHHGRPAGRQGHRPQGPRRNEANDTNSVRGANKTARATKAGAKGTATSARKGAKRTATAKRAATSAKRNSRTARAGTKATATSARKAAKRTKATAKRAATTTGRTARKAATSTKAAAKRSSRS